MSCLRKTLSESHFMDLSKCKHRFHYSVFLIAIVSCGLLTSCQRQPATHKNDLASPLLLEASSLNVGDINEGETKSGVILVRNTSNSPVVIEETTASCGCTSVKAEPTVILPAGGGSLLYKLTPQGRRGRFYSKMTVRWSTNEGRRHGAIDTIVQGNALFAMDISPFLVDFGTVRANSSTDPVQIEVRRGTQNLPFAVMRAESSSPGVVINVNETSQEKWAISCRLCTGKFPSGPIRESIVISFLDGNGKELLQREVNVIAEIKGLVSVTPKTLYCGVMLPGETKEGTLSFRAPLGKSAKIKFLRVEPDNDCIHLHERETGLQSELSLVDYQVSTKNERGNMSGRIVVEFEDIGLGTLSLPIILYAK